MTPSSGHAGTGPDDDAAAAARPGAAERGPAPAQDDPAPLREEIARDSRRPHTGVSPAQFEVRFRRLALLLMVLVPLVVWLVSALR